MRVIGGAGRLGGALAAFVLLFLATVSPGHAVDPSERLADPALEARARVLSRELRCLVCRNQSVDDSSASLAHDLRLRLRERLKAGDTDAQVLDYMVDRYGMFVLLDPPFRPVTWLLWLGPPALLGAAGLAVWARMRKRPRSSSPPPLSADEIARAKHLLGDLS